MPNTAIDSLIKKKKAAKAELAKEFGFKKNKPLLGIFLDQSLSEFEELEVTAILDGAKDLGVKFVILADSNLEAFEHDNVLEYNRLNREQLLCACDVALVFDFSDIEEMLIHGIVPVSSERSGVEDYNPNRETGNSFIFRKNTTWSIFAALVRAIETFKFPYDWKHLVRQGRDSVGGGF